MLEGWRFHLGDAPGAEANSFNDSDWKPVSVSHDWSITSPVAENPSGCPSGFFPNGLGWLGKLPVGGRVNLTVIRSQGALQYTVRKLI